jgi:hypothetical protein
MGEVRLGVYAYLIDEPRGDATVRQPRGKLGRVVASEHAVADVEIVCDQVTIPKVVLQPRQGCSFAALSRSRTPAASTPPDVNHTGVNKQIT